ncbi:MAG: trigger factor [Oscillospiraceae bacterium]
MIVKNVEKKEDNTLTFQVESDAAEFEAAVNAAYLKNKHSINIPGFRKGKAPRAVVEGMYGAEVFYQDAMDELAPKAFEQGVTENDVKFVGAPSIVDVNVTDDKTVAYTFSVTLYPEVTLGQYKGLSAERYPAEVDEDEIGYELEAARKRNSRKVDVEREAQMGDVANIDFDGYLNGERFDGGKAEAYDLELGSGSFVPGFEEQIVGMNIGDEKDIDITFPENYAPELAGKAVVFKIKLNNLSVNELPELDDEFAKDNGFDTLDEYKADVKADLEKRKTEQRDGEVRADLMHKAIENMTVAVPEVMVKEKAEEIIRNYARNFGVTDNSIPMDKLCEMLGLNEEAMKTSIMPAAEAQVKNDLLLEAIVAAEGFAPTEEETEEYIAKTAEKLGAKAEELKQYFGVDFIAEEQKKEMASNIIFDTAIITEAAPEEKAEEKAEETEKRLNNYSGLRICSLGY